MRNGISTSKYVDILNSNTYCQIALLEAVETYTSIRNPHQYQNFKIFSKLIELVLPDFT
jgi:hypothetical protein